MTTETLEEQVVALLQERGFHISFAESCTGGLCSARLVSVANASAVFDAGVVTYANEAKVKYLGVKPETIEQYGVVSEPVAGQMAEGVARAQKAQVGVGVSGIAGPTGGTAEKPVGMVCFGFFVDGELTTVTKKFGDLGRNVVREAAAEFVFEMLAGLLEDKNETL
ncbi:MAG: CinA family protein [Lachnospiraceae bacterium]|nr:CinA family protein [Lachnospiraceae bacterium]